MKTIIRPETEMKDSGDIYIGKMPSNWRLTLYKYFADSGLGLTILKEEVNDLGVPIYSATQDSSIFGYIKNPKLKLSKGDLVIPARGNSIGCTTYVEDDVATCTQTTIYSKVSGINSKFLFYCSIGLKEKWFYHVQTAIPQITVSQVQNNKVPLPALSEQQAISDYLDETCSKIDEIIVEAKVTIEEYKELKQSVIFEAVTKGLDKNVEMMETGEKWLNNIPNHWRMEKGKNLLFETNFRSVDGRDELLTVSQYTGVTPRSKKNVTMFQAASLVDYKICKVGDIAANTMWMWAGAVGVSKYHGVISPSYNTYRQKHNDYNSNYLDYLLRIKPLVDEYASLSTGIRASRLRLYPTQFLSINYPVPPLCEQEDIVEFLDKRIVEIDSLIAEKESLINDLEAYKKSLIYEVVTGKRRVV